MHPLRETLRNFSFPDFFKTRLYTDLLPRLFPQFCTVIQKQNSYIKIEAKIKKANTT